MTQRTWFLTLSEWDKLGEYIRKVNEWIPLYPLVFLLINIEISR